MLTKIKRGKLAVILMGVFAFANAQQPPMPKALTDLMMLEGKWEGSAKLTMEGKTHEFIYYSDFKKTADGNGMYMEEWFSCPDVGDLKGSNIIGYNANDGKIHWFTVDNFGTTHDHLGKWITPEHFFMQANELQQDKKFVENIDMLFKGKDNLELSLSAMLDGVEIEKGTVRFDRVKF